MPTQALSERKCQLVKPGLVCLPTRRRNREQRGITSGRGPTRETEHRKAMAREHQEWTDKTEILDALGAEEAGKCVCVCDNPKTKLGSSERARAIFAAQFLQVKDPTVRTFLPFLRLSCSADRGPRTDSWHFSYFAKISTPEQSTLIERVDIPLYL